MIIIAAKHVALTYMLYWHSTLSLAVEQMCQMVDKIVENYIDWHSWWHGTYYYGTITNVYVSAFSVIVTACHCIYIVHRKEAK